MLEGWEIVISNGLVMLGCPKEGGWLDPVFELQCMMQPIQRSPASRPELVTIRIVKPLLTFASLKKVRVFRVVDETIVIPVSDLSHKERSELAKGVDNCLELIAGMRAQDAGIVLSKEMPKGNGLP